MNNLILFISSSIILTGCLSKETYTAYDEKYFDNSKAAVVETESYETPSTILNKYMDRLYIYGVDGNSVGMVEKILLKPGFHEVDVRYLHSNYYSESKLSFIVDEGNSYMIKKELYPPNKFIFWVENKTTGLRVNLTEHEIDKLESTDSKNRIDSNAFLRDYKREGVDIQLIAE